MSTPQSRMIPVGAFLQVTEIEEGQYKVKEIPQPSTLPKVVNDSDRKEISIDIQFLKVTSPIIFPTSLVYTIPYPHLRLTNPPQLVGYVIPSTYEIGIEPYFLGVKAGATYYGSLTKGMGIQIEAGFYEGDIRINKEGDEVVLRVDINGRLFMPNIHEAVTLLSLA